MKLLYQQDGGGGDGGGDGDPWHSTLPENIQTWDEVKNSDTPDKFWGQMENMRSMIGQSIRIPGENASAEDHKAFNDKLLAKVPGLVTRPDFEDADASSQFYNSLGRPEEADKYTMPEIDNKGVELDLKPAEAFRAVAHKHGLTQKQYEGIVTEMTQGNIEAAIVADTANKDQQTLLKNEWGLAYENNIVRIQNVAKNTGAPPALVEALAAGKVDPGTGKWLLGIANSFKGEGSNLIDDKSQNGLLAPQQARQEISEIMNNKEHDYWHQEKPGHGSAMKYMRELYKMAETSDNAEVSHSGSAGVGGIEFRG